MTIIAAKLCPIEEEFHIEQSIQPIAVTPTGAHRAIITVYADGNIFNLDCHINAIEVTVYRAAAHDETLAAEMEEVWQRDRKRREQAKH